MGTRQLLEAALEHLNEVRAAPQAGYLKLLRKTLWSILDELRDIHGLLDDDADSFLYWVSDGFDSGSLVVAQLIKERLQGPFSNLLPWSSGLERDLQWLHRVLRDLVDGELDDWLAPLLSVDPRLVRQKYPDHEQNLARGLDKRLVRVPKLARKLKRWLVDAEAKVDELIRSTRPGYEPETEDVETLYHTTVNAKRLARTGFSRGAQRAEGLGGQTTTRSGKHAISFTSDIYVAKEIARALKEAILIAKGKLRRHHIVDWARRAGILRQVLRGGEGLGGGSDDPNHPANVLGLYQAFLTLSNRYDPMFFGDTSSLMKTLARKTQRDVGILVCRVNMRHPDISYHKGMREYRVPAEAVLEITRVVS